MKKFATLLAVILMAFSVCFLTACTQPYSKIYLEVYDAQGTKLTLDEDYRFVLNDDGENDFSLNVKVRGVKKEKVTVGFTKKSSTNAFSILDTTSRILCDVSSLAILVIKSPLAIYFLSLPYTYNSIFER